MFRPIAKVWQTLRSSIATEVPADMAACEFDCRELDCNAQEWLSCDKRHRKAEAIRSLQHKETLHS